MDSTSQWVVSELSQFTKQAMAIAVAIGVGGVIAEGFNYWQGTPPTVSELYVLQFMVGVAAFFAALGLSVDGARWLWRRRKSSN